MLRLTAFAFALALSLAPSFASAQDARALFVRGSTAYDNGDYEGAVAAWVEAYELDPRPLLQYNLAQAYERLNRLEEAAAAYELFIGGAPDDGRIAQARARMLSLQERLAATGILFQGGPDGAVLLVDGEDRGRLPRPDPLRVSPGSHQILIQAEGFADFTSAVAVNAGQTLELEVAMTASAAVDGGGNSEPAASGGISPIGIGVLAGGGALLVGGVVTGVLALGAADSAEFNDDGDADSARTLALVTDILVPVGVVAVGTGVVLMLVLDGGSDDDASAAVEVLPLAGPDVGGLLVSGSF